MRDDILGAIRKVNGRRRVRLVGTQDVVQALYEARQYGVGFVSGGSVAKAYAYPAYTSAVAAVRAGHNAYAVLFGTHDAHINSSQVTWFGPTSCKGCHLHKWAEGVRGGSVLLGQDWIRVSGRDVRLILRERDETELAHARAIIPSIPDVLITAEDSILAGNCPRETERVARAFRYRPTLARTVANKFPALARYVKRVADFTERRAAR